MWHVAPSRRSILLLVHLLIDASDRHDPVIGVVAFVPTFLDSDTIIGSLPSESVTTPSHVPILKQNSHHTPILPKGKGDNAKAAGVCLFRALVR